MFALRSLFARCRGRGTAGATSEPVPQARGDWAARAVWLAWLGMAAWLAVFVSKRGHNLPVTDEWAFVPLFYSGWEDKLSWLFERHCEHRFILGRAIFLGLLWVTGMDFRAGMWATVVFLALTAAVLILAARKLRGSTHLSDVMFPLLMLHLGHTENVLMGYQLVFTLTVLHLALFSLVVAHSDSLRPAKAAFLGALLLVPIALGGGQGLVFAAPLGCWVLWRFVSGLRETGLTLRSAFTGLLGLGVAGYLLWSVLEAVVFSPTTEVHNRLTESVRVAIQVFGMGVGPVGLTELPGLGLGLLIAESLTALALLVVFVRKREERPIAGGLLALLAGVAAFALAVGHGRDSGWCSRFAAFSAIGPVVMALSIARYVRPVRRNVLWVVGVLCAGAVMTGANAYHGNGFAGVQQSTYHSLRIDVKNKLPIDLLAARNVGMWVFTPRGWRVLWQNHFPLLEGVPGPYTGAVIPVKFAAENTPDFAELARNCTAFTLPIGEGKQDLLAVRVWFRAPVRTAWERFHLEWTDPDTGELKRSAVVTWVHPGRDEWTVFVVRGAFTSGRLFMGRSACPIEITRVEVLPGG